MDIFVKNKPIKCFLKFNKYYVYNINQVRGKMKKVAIIIFSIIATAAIFLSLYFFFTIKESNLIQITGFSMGSSYKIKIADEVLEPYKLKKEIKNKLNDLNKKFSIFNEKSEISKINQSKTLNPINVSEEFYSVLQKAYKISETTNGAFDVTVAPLVRLWGFGKEGRIEKFPEKTKIENALLKIGYKNYSLNDDKTIAKKNPDLEFDFGAIAAGFAADTIANMLVSKGINNFLIEIGGEIKAKGYKNPENATLWIVAIKSPDKNLPPEVIIPLYNQSISSSGSYENFVIINGEKYSHDINPKTGYPPLQNLVGVSVINDTECAYSDGLAAGLMVLGLDEGLKIADKNKIIAVFITLDDGKLNYHYSKQFNAQFKGYNYAD